MGAHWIFCLLFVFTKFGFYCQMAPAAAGSELKQWTPGVGSSFRMESTLLLNEKDARTGKDVGYQVQGAVTVACVWQNPDPYATPDKLLKIELQYPQLLIKSRKAPAPEGFVTHGSKLDSLKNGPIFVHWVNGKIKNVYTVSGEDPAIVNLKIAVASLFQYQIGDSEGPKEEMDASGVCKTSYVSIDSHTLLKRKSNCKLLPPLPFVQHPEKVWSADVDSKREVFFEFNKDLSQIKRIASEESHVFHVAAREDVGSIITARLQLLNSGIPFEASVADAPSVDQAVQVLSKELRLSLSAQYLTLQREVLSCQDDADSCPNLAKLIKENREALHGKNFGTTRSASLFIKLIKAVRNGKKEEIIKVMKHSKNANLLPQLYDVLGTAQTMTAHEAAMKLLNLNSEADVDKAERYFWALALGSQPLQAVIQDLSALIEKPIKSDKLRETMTLTLAAMANRFLQLKESDTTLNKQLKEREEVVAVQKLLSKKLSACKDTDEFCQLMYLRAMKNLGNETSIPQVLEFAFKGSRKVSVAAMKTLKSFPSKFWDANVLRSAEKIYFQLSKLFDSSARTLAIDILLESNPSDATLKHLLFSLTSSDPVYEVKQYLLQRLRQFADNDAEFAARIKRIVNSAGLNHYGALAQRGMTTAFTRPFMSHPSANGSLLTIQEVSGGILKRGIVDVVIDSKEKSHTIFSLGLFAGGLSSFVSSDDSTNSPEEGEEAATAGMELTVMGVQIRPFVFFNGQGELMGHVWSGTGSEKTPAYQALGLLQDSLLYIPLGTGTVAQITLLGGISFDLSGQIQFSLWNRNAHSLVEKNAGVSLQGLVKVDSAYVRSQIEFQVGTEVKLNLVSDIDFYSKVALCMQLKQLDSLIRHNIFKVERIPGSKHRLRKSTYRFVKVPGRCYYLNQKNNDMCRVIFKNT
nr:PREDICTED: microsomal triglyceride transfer protein large subunit [Bemisia tabaci]